VNAFADRFVESAKSECLERMVLLGEPHLRAAVRAFTVIGTGPITCRERLGGVLKFYYREAA
jgi:hypothetical protein